jgi:hypothetical protein
MSTNEMIFGGLVILSVTIAGGVSSLLSYQKMKFDALKQGIGGMTNEDRELLQAMQRSIERIEERLEALEILTMEREREEKFGMKL